ncbi:MAG: HYR domain-containing protein [Verrucomicrobiota bacterium]
MRSWTEHHLWILVASLLPLASCNRSQPPIQSEAPAPVAPPTTAQTARVIPRRTVPLVITNIPQPTEVEPAPAVTNGPPTVVCGSAQTLPCSSSEGMSVTLTATVQDPNGDALSVIWSTDGKERHTDQVAAGSPGNPVELTFSSTMTTGDHAVKVTVRDGTFSAVCETTVTVQKDPEPPVITCPGDISVPVDPGQCTAVVAFTVKATDNCPDVVVTSDVPSGTAFPIGTTTVTCAATDTSGNVADCAFNVTVYLTNRCPKNEGFWRQSPGAWPVSSVRIGSQVYSKSQLLPLLRATVPADASMVLARQVIVAILNTANGSDPRPICAELQQVNALFSSFSGKLPYRVNVSTVVGRSMTGLADRLNAYNSGLLTGNCVP